MCVSSCRSLFHILQPQKTSSSLTLLLDYHPSVLIYYSLPTFEDQLARLNQVWLVLLTVKFGILPLSTLKCTTQISCYKEHNWWVALAATLNPHPVPGDTTLPTDCPHPITEHEDAEASPKFLITLLQSETLPNQLFFLPSFFHIALWSDNSLHHLLTSFPFPPTGVPPINLLHIQYIISFCCLPIGKLNMVHLRLHGQSISLSPSQSIGPNINLVWSLRVSYCLIIMTQATQAIAKIKYLNSMNIDSVSFPQKLYRPTWGS